MPPDLEDSNAAPPLRKSAQRLRWLVSEFEKQVVLTSAETGTTYAVDRDALMSAMADWLKTFLAQERPRPERKQAFVGFAAGLMLRTLIGKKPVRAVAAPEGADDSKPEHFWPEGYLYVAYCINIRGSIIERDFHGTQRPSQMLGDVRTWWSFRENVEEDPSSAIAFLDHFAGDEPNWTVPDLFRNDNSH